LPPPSDRRSRPPGRRARLNAWHRTTGVFAAGFLLFLVATGIPLQFSGTLDLARRDVHAPWILDWYGLEAPEEVWESAGLVAVGDQLFLSGKRLAPLAAFRGAVAIDGLLAAAGEQEVLLIDGASAELLDRFRLESQVERIGLADSRVALATADGVLLADRELVNWGAAEIPEADVAWAERQAATADQTQDYRQTFRNHMLSLERLLQDLHSGRAFGTAGVLIIDAASLLLLFLAVSGLVLWWRAPRR
jgi:hypothetical protein